MFFLTDKRKKELERKFEVLVKKPEQLDTMKTLSIDDVSYFQKELENSKLKAMATPMVDNFKSFNKLLILEKKLCQKENEYLYDRYIDDKDPNHGIEVFRRRAWLSFNSRDKAKIEEERNKLITKEDKETLFLLNFDKQKEYLNLKNEPEKLALLTVERERFRIAPEIYEANLKNIATLEKMLKEQDIKEPSLSKQIRTQTMDLAKALINKGFSVNNEKVKRNNPGVKTQHSGTINL